MSAATVALRERLRHVCWIGGGSCAGKSTVARRLAAQHGLHVYATDELMAELAGRSTRDDCPLLHEFMSMDMDERWMKRSPQAMLETFHWFRGEGFNLITGDLLGLPREPRIVVEGFRLLPSLVAPLLSEPPRAVWLLPTPDFRRAVVEREGRWPFVFKTSDPDRARRNLLERDRMFTDILREETARLNVPSVEVDVTATEDGIAKQVKDLFEL